MVRRLLADADEVYHLAAAVGVQLIATSPIRTIETNIYPTELLLAELGRLHAGGRPVKFFLASTSEVYGKNPKPRWTEEDDLVFGPTTRPRWSYGASKAIDEFLCLAYWRQRGLPVVIGRLFNVVGPRQTGRLRHGAAAFRRRRLGRRAAGGPRRRPPAALLRPRGRRGPRDPGPDAVAGGRGRRLQHRQRPAGCDSGTGPAGGRPRSIRGLPIQFQSYAEAYGEDFEDCRRRVPDLTRLRSHRNFAPLRSGPDHRGGRGWKRGN